MNSKEKHRINLNKKNQDLKNYQTYQISIKKYNKNQETIKNNNLSKFPNQISKEYSKEHKTIKSFDDKKNNFSKKRNKSSEKENLNNSFSYKQHSLNLKKKINLINLEKKQISKSHMNSIILEEQKLREDKAILEAYYAKKLSLEKIDQESRFLFEDDEEDNSIYIPKNIHDKETTAEEEEKNLNEQQKKMLNIIDSYFSRSRLQILEASYENKMIDVKILMYDFHILSEKINRMKEYFQPFIITKIEKYYKPRNCKNEYELKSYPHSKEKRKNNNHVISTFFLPKVSISIDKKNNVRNKSNKNKSYNMKKEHKIIGSLSNIKSFRFERKKKTILQNIFESNSSSSVNINEVKDNKNMFFSQGKKDKSKPKIKKSNSFFNDINNKNIFERIFYFLNNELKKHPLRNINKIFRQIFIKECINIIQIKILRLNNSKKKEKEILIQKENKLQEFLKNYL